jgi:hypothetical protein
MSRTARTLPPLVFLVLSIILAKSFTIREGLRLQARIDMFNALNHTSWSNPARDLNASTSGRILTTYPARSMQIALRLAF